MYHTYKNLSQNKQTDLNKYGIKTAYKNMNLLKNNIYSNFKNKIELNDKTDLICKINCNNCGVSYIGQRRQYPNKRIPQCKSATITRNYF